MAIAAAQAWPSATTLPMRRSMRAVGCGPARSGIGTARLMECANGIAGRGRAYE